ncbi:hypothetical protein KIN20_036344 [Parelaphostrongylus tenuis]|uniref:Uncharacterized protein n=1 Tax=Parelaphostrongylus tenuis TaxID=148309 RepID=A0AAD5WLK9_PARTN|nr:hypothetical protein KIN20_036344 [Parelaphostrongylus tenuis]
MSAGANRADAKTDMNTADSPHEHIRPTCRLSSSETSVISWSPLSDSFRPFVSDLLGREDVIAFGDLNCVSRLSPVMPTGFMKTNVIQKAITRKWNGHRQHYNNDQYAAVVKVIKTVAFTNEKVIYNNGAHEHSFTIAYKGDRRQKGSYR